MARKINVKLILKLREAKLSRNQIADSRHIARNSVSDVQDKRCVPLSSVKQLLEDIYHEVNLDEGFGLPLETKGHTATLTRESQYTMVIDCDADAIRFIDYDAFFVPSYSPTVIDEM